MSEIVSETGSDPKNWLAALTYPANRLFHEHLFLAVVVPGAVGGFISWLLGNKLEADIFNSTFPAATLSLIFGALAAMTFVVVLTNVDKSDTPRLIALAFLAGLAYPPVLQAGVNILGVSTDGLVGFQNQAQEQREVFEDAARNISAKQMDGESLSTLASESTELANLLAELPESERSEFVSSLVGELQSSLRPQEEELVFSALSQSFGAANIDLEQYLPGDDDYLFSDIPNRLRQIPTDIAGNVDLNNYYPFGDPPKAVYWFLLTVDFPSDYEISVISRDSDDLVAGLYRARELSLVYSNDDFAGKSDPVITGPLDPGEYYLRISEYFGDDVGPAEINFKDLNASSLLDPNQLATDGQTIGADELGRAIAIIGDPLPERWVTMRVEIAGVYTVTVQNGDPDVDLVAELYDVDNGRLVATDDDSAGLFNPEMIASLTPGDYFIKVTEWGGIVDVGDFSVTLAQAPAQAQAF